MTNEDHAGAPAERRRRWPRTGVALAALLLLACATAASASAARYVAGPYKTYYVSPGGSDSNPGTISQPFATIAKARSVVSTVNKSMTGDIVVYLRGGVHKQSSTLSFTSSDSGFNNYEVIYQAYENEVPRISGGQTITGWTLDSGSIYKANVGKSFNTRQLFVDGVRATRARSTGGLGGTVTKTSTGYTSTSTAMQGWGNPGDIEFVFTGSDGNSPNVAFSESRCGVDTITGNGSLTTFTLDDPCWTNFNVIKDSWAGLEPNKPTRVENAYELLDQPGEWYLNRSTGYLYYYPLGGQDVTKVDVIAPVVETLVSGTGVHDVAFEGITFEHATWLQPSTNEGLVQHLADYMFTGSSLPSKPGPEDLDLIPGSVSFSGSYSLRFERDTFRQLGAGALVLDGGSHDNIVNRSEIEDISGGGIRIGHNQDGRDEEDPKNANNSIVNSEIHHIGRDYAITVGIFAPLATNLTIRHNEIYQTPYSAICMCWTWSPEDGGTTYNGGNNIDHNHIHDIMQEPQESDGGGIYTAWTQEDEPRGRIFGNYIVPKVANDHIAIGLYNDVAASWIDAKWNVIDTVNGEYAYMIQTVGGWPNAEYNDFQFNYSDGGAYFSGNKTNTFTNNGSLSGGPVSGIISNAGIQSGGTGLAQAGVVSTSEPVTGYIGYLAPRSTDGVKNVDGELWQTGVGKGDDSWWQVDLGSRQSLSNIAITYANYLGKFYRVPDEFEVEVAYTPTSGWYPTRTVKTADMPTEGGTYSSGTATRTYSLLSGTTARYLRIRFPNGGQNVDDIVALDEVEIW